MKNYLLTELLAHQGAMMLLDRIVTYDEESMVCEVVVSSNGLFGDNKTLPALLGIEYMAQTISAHSNLMDKLAQRPTHLGFLLGTRLYTSYVDCFTVGSRLTVTVKRIIQEQAMGVFNCNITASGVLAEAKLNVYQPNSASNRIQFQTDKTLSSDV